MRNLYYFVKKFGKQSFKQFPFNEVDSLILSQLSYLNLENFVPKLEEKLSDSLSLIDKLNAKTIYELSYDTLDEKRNKKLLKLLLNTTRYQGLKVNYYQNQFCPEKIEQFCALTFVFDEFIYIAYRGTDLTFVGWQEDFNLALLDVIPAQADAYNYLDIVAKLSDKSLYLGGHSKGGNLALYAALASSDSIKDRIIKIYDHDGPGFSSDIYHSQAFLKLKNKLDKTTCREAMVGILLYHSGKMRFVDSRSIGIFQHDPYNWKVTKDGKFKLVKNSNLMSRTFEKTVSMFIEKTSIEDRKKFIEIVFKLAKEKPKSTIFDFKKHPISYIKGIHTRYKALTHEERIFFKSILKGYQKLWSQNFRYYLKRSLSFRKKFVSKRV